MDVITFENSEELDKQINELDSYSSLMEENLNYVSNIYKGDSRENSFKYIFLDEEKNLHP